MTEKNEQNAEHAERYFESRNGWKYIICTCGAEIGPYYSEDYVRDAFELHAQRPVEQPVASPAKLSPEKQLENLYDALAESIANASPEEIAAEMTPEDVVKARELKAKMLELVDEYKVIEWLRERHANCLSIAAQKAAITYLTNQGREEENESRS